MVLQRDQEILIYGTADEDEKVTVSFNGQQKSTQTKNGQWQVSLAPMPTGGSHSLKIKGNNEVTFNNILLGDVWVLGGQSNMAREYRTYKYLMEQLPKAEMNENIRWFKIANNSTADQPSKKVHIDLEFNKSWQVSCQELLPRFSPCWILFGLHRYKQNNVPLGLIMAGRGATMINSWIKKDILKKDPRYQWILDPKQNRNNLPDKGKPNDKRPSALYNGTIYPLMPFSIKGVLWYQGESDSPYSNTYEHLFPHMIRSWREEWGQGDFPILFAQLSSCQDRRWSACYEPKESAWAWQREAQTYGLNEPKTAMIITHDLGEWEDIHPQAKELVGKRFAQQLKKLEEGKDLNPSYKSHVIEDSLQSASHFKI